MFKDIKKRGENDGEEMKIRNIKIADFTIRDMLEELAFIYNNSDTGVANIMANRINDFLNMIEKEKMREKK
jgi:hypothetical protein